MAAPWDIPSGPYSSDPSPDPIFAAVGSAMNEWESLELELARLFANLLGLPTSTATSHVAYAMAGVFSQRIRVVEEMGRQYFVSNPDQSLEGDFENVVCEVRRLSDRRNDIAHGMVRPCWADSEKVLRTANIEGYVLIPSTYRAKKFSGSGQPSYIFSSVDINAYGEAFRKYRDKIRSVYRRISQKPFRQFST